MNYSYCTIEEAWGDNLNKENRKKKKKERRKYHSKYEGYVEDTSYSDGLHDNHCSIEKNTNLSNKNRHRHSHGKKARKIQNRRNDNYEISYSRSNDEYKKYRKETKNISKNKMKPIEKIENEQYLTPSMYNPYSEEEQVSPYEAYNSDSNLENEEKNNYVSNNNYISNGNDTGNESGNEYENYSNYNMDLIEGFESNGEDLDNHSLSRPGNEEVNDVQTNNKSKRAGNLIDKLLDEKQMAPSSGEEMSSEEDNKTDTESEISSDEGENNLNTNKNTNQNIKNSNNNIKVTKKDIDYKLTSLNRNLNTIIKQMNKTQFFDDDAQDNIHDLILFVLFGIFIIFILDSIYKLGKNSSPSIGY